MRSLLPGYSGLVKTTEERLKTEKPVEATLKRGLFMVTDLLRSAVYATWRTLEPWLGLEGNERCVEQVDRGRSIVESTIFNRRRLLTDVLQ